LNANTNKSKKEDKRTNRRQNGLKVHRNITAFSFITLCEIT